jgi:hypothetical protein
VSIVGRLIGGPGAVTALGEAATGVAEVFVPSATRRMEYSAEAQMAALRQLGEEYQHPALSWFDRMVNGLNRLPRPFLAFGTIGLFVYAMVDPEAFAVRMVGLNAVPEPLWWLLGAIVAFYFGARETRCAGGECGAGGVAAGVIPVAILDLWAGLWHGLAHQRM